MNSISRLAISVLLENNISSLPVDVKNLRIHGHTIIFSNYDKSLSLIEGTRLEKIINENSALALSRDGKYCVLLNPALGVTQRLEKIAHELGHIACEHEGTDGFCGVTDDCAQRIIQEAEAEQFKTELLAPTIILYKMGADTTEKIQSITGVSKETAEKILANVMLRNELKSPFLSDDERELWENFKKNACSNIKRPRITFKNIFMAMMSVITICVILLVILDSKNNFILKGNYVEPQYEENTPLTPDDYYPTNNDKDNFFEPKATKNNATPTKNNYEDNYTVYITEHGEKYHKTSCRYLSDSKIAIDIYDAIAEGYEPCSVCKP